MENRIKELKELYREEIKTIFTHLPSGEEFLTDEDAYENFGSTISEVFKITDLKGYGEYVDILSKIEGYDMQLAYQLENYLMKEINLVALLGLHVAMEENKNNS